MCVYVIAVWLIQYWTWETQPRGWRTVFCHTVGLPCYISWGWSASTLIASNRQRVLSVCTVALQDSDSTGVFTCPQGQCHNTHSSRYCMRFIIFANLAACLIWDFDELELCQSVSQILFWGCQVSLRHVKLVYDTSSLQSHFPWVLVSSNVRNKTVCYSISWRDQ